MLVLLCAGFALCCSLDNRKRFARLISEWMKGACRRDIAVSHVAIPEDADSAGPAGVPQPLVTLKRE